MLILNYIFTQAISTRQPTEINNSAIDIDCRPNLELCGRVSTYENNAKHNTICVQDYNDRVFILGLTPQYQFEPVFYVFAEFPRKT